MLLVLDLPACVLKDNSTILDGKVLAEFDSVVNRYKLITNKRKQQALIGCVTEFLNTFNLIKISLG